MPRRSGRYPWGSGENPYQRGSDFLARISELKSGGWTENAANVRREFGLNLDEYRWEKNIASEERRRDLVATANRMRDKEGMTVSAIGKAMGVNESTVRSWFDTQAETRMNLARDTADFLKKQVDSKGLIDVGANVNRELNVSPEKMNQALYMLEREGYVVLKGRMEQTTNPGKFTTQKVLAPPGTPAKEVYNLDKINTITEYTSRDGGATFDKFHYPSSMDSKRLQIRYAEDGGTNKDGVVELRRGVPDLSLGNDHYSQVRILVDGKKYIKGMAVYSDDLPPGVDAVFNTNKSKTTPKLEVLKDIKSDPDNPFGSLIKAGGQSTYVGKDGKEHLSLINKRAGEGDWTDWKDALPSQFLSKQSIAMAKKQLTLARVGKTDEFNDIKSLTQPTIKKHLLEKFADECDAASVHLKAAALPGQKYHVIIPVNSLKDSEIYAPQYAPGTKVALIRYPHGGTFEIPILTVNNREPNAKKLIGPTSIDAVGINKKIADRLSGADFDGDTVMVIPTHDSKGKVKITSTPPLKALEGFDPKFEYQGSVMTDSKGKTLKDPDGNPRYQRDGIEFKPMKNTGTEMGKISNLITDMTLAGADTDKLARAVKHSMVVIDAEKHKLDYKKSYADNNIAALVSEYQRTIDKDGNVKIGGASTILSKSKGEISVTKRQGQYKINDPNSKDYDPTRPEGAKIYKEADDLYYPVRTKDKKSGITILTTVSGDKVRYDPSDPTSRERYAPVKRVDELSGEVSYTNKAGDISYALKKRTQPSTNMAETDDARTLLSEARHPMEVVYAEYANSMKSLANQARKELLSTGNVRQDTGAKAIYADQVASLDAKLNEALLNAPRERAAQRKANAEVAAKKANNPDLTPGDIKKAKQQAITKYREELGSVARRSRNIEITDKEWEAIQKGAISENKLKRILNNTDTDKLRERATPKSSVTQLSAAKISRIKAMSNSNFTLEEIAKALGLSTSTVSKYLKGG